MEEEKMVLSHEPEPGYRKIFHISVLIGFIYLGYIFFRYIVL